MSVIPLADIEAVVREDPLAPDRWAVYADALDELGHTRRAAAVRVALAGSPHTPEPSVPEEAAWWYGHWRALRVRTPDELAAALAQPWARFLEELVLAEEFDVLPAALPAPPSLTRLRVEGAIHLEGGPALRQLQEIHAPHWTPPEPLDAAALTRLVVAAPGALVASHAPSLRWLELRGPVALEELADLLASPVGSSLRVVRAHGGDLAAVAALLRGRDVTVEVTAVRVSGDEVSVPVRRLLDAEEHVARCVRLEPPATALAQRVALYEACDALGLGVVRDIPPVAWVRVFPPEVARPIATAMAARAGCGVRVLELRAVPDTESIWLDAHAEEVLPDGAVAPIEFDLTRAARDVKPLQRDDEDGWGVDDALDALTAELFYPISVATLLPTVPVPWHPDPWALVQVGAGPAPRALYGSAPVDLSAELGRYLRFRVGRAGALARSTAPDLARWTPRLLRRHGLDEAPTDPAHPFWAEWRERTRSERRGDPQPGQIPSHKLSAPGRWVLAPDEVAALARALDEPIDHHAAPRELADGLDAVRRALDATEDVEVEVR